MWALTIWSEAVAPRKATCGFIVMNRRSMTSEPRPRIRRLPTGTMRTPGSAPRVSIGAMTEEPRLTPSTSTTPSSGVIRPRPASVAISSTAAMEDWNSQVISAASR